MKDDVLYFLHLILMYCGLWVCDAFARGMDRVQSEFQEGSWVERESRTT